MDHRPDSGAAPIEATYYRVEADGTLFLVFNDGHQSSITPERLRAGCPCAICREEHAVVLEGQAAEDESGSDESGPGESAPGSLVVREPEAGIPGFHRLVSVAPVGRYGLAPTWEDGHGTGIYSWDILRGLCDCIACRLARGHGAGE